MGSLESADVFRITNVAFISLTTSRYDTYGYGDPRTGPSSTPGAYQLPADHAEGLGHPCAEMAKYFASGSFYFSYDFDLTRRAQIRLAPSSASSMENDDPPSPIRESSAEDLVAAKSGFWSMIDRRFLWNGFLLKQLLQFRSQLPEHLQLELDEERLLVVAIQGFVGICDLPRGAQFAIISRLSCRRAGTRFNIRGVDDEGNVANNVESELLLYEPLEVGSSEKAKLASLVQVRGSVPVFWEQQGFQAAKHRLQVTRPFSATHPAFVKHMHDLMHHYGAVQIINLLAVDKEGENALTQEYSLHVRGFASELLERYAEQDTVEYEDSAKPAEVAASEVRMINFDFSSKFRLTGSLDAVCDELANAVTRDISEFGWFVADKGLSTNHVAAGNRASTAEESRASAPIHGVQRGVFRTNCLDCLDRTNVVQTSIAKRAVQFLGHTQPGLAGVIRSPAFVQAFNDMWADNGDALSKIYAGTGALKSGFTRTGKRTIAGFMDDFKKSATRLYINNFQDKSTQIIIDMLLGKSLSQVEVSLYNPIQDAIQASLSKRLQEYAHQEHITVGVSTYNLSGRKHAEFSEDISSLLLHGNGKDNSVRAHLVY